MGHWTDTLALRLLKLSGEDWQGSEPGEHIRFVAHIERFREQLDQTEFNRDICIRAILFP
jgi:hypothetical protein